MVAVLFSPEGLFLFLLKKFIYRNNVIGRKMLNFLTDKENIIKRRDVRVH